MSGDRHRRRWRAIARALPAAATLLGAGAIGAFVMGLVPVAAGSEDTGGQSKGVTGSVVVQPAQPVPQAARPCTAPDLQVTVGPAGAFHGSATQELVLTNRGADACFLPGAPSVGAVFDDDSQQVADPGQFASSRADLQSGQSAELLLGTPGSCAGADSSRRRAATRVALGLTRGDTIQARGTYLDVQCGRPQVVLFTTEDAPAGP